MLSITAMRQISGSDSVPNTITRDELIAAGAIVPHPPGVPGVRLTTFRNAAGRAVLKLDAKAISTAAKEIARWAPQSGRRPRVDPSDFDREYWAAHAFQKRLSSAA